MIVAASNMSGVSKATPIGGHEMNTNRCEAEWVAGNGADAARCEHTALSGRMFCEAHEADYVHDFGHHSEDAITLHIITANGTDAVATVETGKHGGAVLAIRDTNGTTLMGMKVEHVSDVILSTLLDAGTVATVRDTFGI